MPQPPNLMDFYDTEIKPQFPQLNCTEGSDENRLNLFKGQNGDVGKLVLSVLNGWNKGDGNTRVYTGNTEAVFYGLRYEGNGTFEDQFVMALREEAKSRGLELSNQDSLLATLRTIEPSQSGTLLAIIPELLKKYLSTEPNQ